MGICLDCFRRLNKPDAQETSNILTPDAETRRQAAAEAANRRFEQNEKRGVDENELIRLKQRAAEIDRIEKLHAKLPKQTGDNSGGLKWQMN